MELTENITANDHTILRDRAYKLLAKTLETLTTSLSNVPQQLHVVQPLPAMHSEGYNICGAAHESGSCMV